MGMKSRNVLMIRARPVIFDPRVRNEAETLVKAGYSVHVIERDRKNLSEKYDTMYGMKVSRVDDTRFMKLIPYDTFRLRYWWNNAYKEAVKIYEKDPFEIVHCHDLDALPIGIRLKKKYGVKVIYDAAEVWPYMIHGEVPKFIIKRFIKLEKKMIKQSDAIITVGRGYKEYLVSIGAPENEIKMVMNAKRRVVEKYTPSGNEIPVVVYLGNLRENRFVMELIDAVEQVGGVKAVIGGKGALYKEVEARAKSGSNVEFLGTIPMDEVIQRTLKSDVVYCIFDPSHPLTRIGSPNKFFEALVTGRPLLASKGTDVGRLVSELKCGIVVDASPEGIKKGLEFIARNPDKLEEMGRNAFRALDKGFSWEDQEKTLLSIYSKLLSVK